MTSCFLFLPPTTQQRQPKEQTTQTCLRIHIWIVCLFLGSLWKNIKIHHCFVVSFNIHFKNQSCLLLISIQNSQWQVFLSSTFCPDELADVLTRKRNEKASPNPLPLFCSCFDVSVVCFGLQLLNVVALGVPRSWLFQTWLSAIFPRRRSFALFCTPFVVFCVLLHVSASWNHAWRFRGFFVIWGGVFALFCFCLSDMRASCFLFLPPLSPQQDQPNTNWKTSWTLLLYLLSGSLPKSIHHCFAISLSIRSKHQRCLLFKKYRKRFVYFPQLESPRVLHRSSEQSVPIRFANSMSSTPLLGTVFPAIDMAFLCFLFYLKQLITLRCKPHKPSLPCNFTVCFATWAVF